MTVFVEIGPEKDVGDGGRRGEIFRICAGIFEKNVAAAGGKAAVNGR
jgi:hypothetical protein